MFRTLLLAFIAITVFGCQNYHTNLDLPQNFERIQITPIQTTNKFDSSMIAHSLINELAGHYTIVHDNPDITISISGKVKYDPFSIPFVSYALLTIDTPTGSAGTIKSTEGWLVVAGLKRFAKKIKNILTKRR